MPCTEYLSPVSTEPRKEEISHIYPTINCFNFSKSRFMRLVFLLIKFGCLLLNFFFSSADSIENVWCK